MSHHSSWGGGNGSSQPPTWYGPPQQPPTPDRRRRAGLLVAVVLTVVAVLTAGAVVAVVAISGSDGSDGADRSSATGDAEPADDPSEAGPTGSDLVTDLETTGYSCYDSLPDPKVRRCFLSTATQDGNDPSGVRTTVGVEVDPTDVVKAFSVAAVSESRDARAEIAAARRAWRQVAPGLLGSDAGPMASRFGKLVQAQVDWGNVEFRTAPTSVFVTAVGRVPPPPEFKGLGTSPAEVTTALEAAGFRCDAGLTCQRGNGYSALAQPGGDEVGSLSVVAYNPALYRPGSDRPRAIRRQILRISDQLDLGGPDLAGLLDQGFAAGDRVPVGADISGLHYTFVVWWVSPGHVFKATLTIEPVRWG